MLSSANILNGKILIVDDESANILLLERLLRDAGYVAVESTTDPSHVCELYRNNRYDLILLDLQMPSMDGFQVMDLLKDIDTGGYLPVLVLTAEPQHKLRALKAGAKDFLSKPLDLAEVLVRVHNMLEVRLLHLEAKNLYEVEKRITDKLHSAFAQRALPVLPGLSLSASYVPATEDTRVGGDWYDAIGLPSHRIFFAIGDVAGHGIDAAITMNRSRYALVSSALREPDPALMLGHVNEELIREDAPMVTALAGFADSQTYEIVYSSAGHPPPVLLEPGSPPRLLEFGGPPLGVLENPEYSTFRIQTVPGALLVLYTDGAIEHSKNILEGEALLLSVIASLAGHTHAAPASFIHDAIFNGRSVGDDVAILTIRFSPDPPSA
ncbi:MAG TPA: SpoIIE family protein phosphatase [Candidatus Baltobacteraceae bacterium]|nr:SpoIIE family protein phosphatase [Candidatus Baltobacteraceae bacterium]